MTTQLVARNTINSVDDMLYGAGLGVSIGSVSVNGAETGTYFDNANKTKRSFMSASVKVKLDFEAGYSISGDYICSVKADGDTDDLTTHEGRIAYVQSKSFGLLIDYSDDDDTPFDNWYVEVENDEELLKEILAVGRDSYDESNDEAVLNEAFSFSYHSANLEVAYGLQHLFTLPPAQYTKLAEPYGAEFTTKLENKIKEAILTYFAAFK